MPAAFMLALRCHCLVNLINVAVYLAGCEHIRRVRFHHCAYIDDDALLAMVDRLKGSLQQLELSSCDISDEGLGHLTQLQSVFVTSFSRSYHNYFEDKSVHTHSYIWPSRAVERWGKRGRLPRAPQCRRGPAIPRG